MTITIRAGSWARPFIPQESTQVTLSEGAAVADALEALPIPSDEIGLTVLKGRAVRRDTILHDGDRLEILPVIIGG